MAGMVGCVCVCACVCGAGGVGVCVCVSAHAGVCMCLWCGRGWWWCVCARARTCTQACACAWCGRCVCARACTQACARACGAGGAGWSWGKLGQLGENSLLSHPFTPHHGAQCPELPATGAWEPVGGNSGSQGAPKWSEKPTERSGVAKGEALPGPA